MHQETRFSSGSKLPADICRRRPENVCAVSAVLALSLIHI